ncbi:MAG: rhodanese-like domain-containing protein [Proteobacteria bacterium]|nr:rhodanese-like domain-containing protein [Pseudomonadota bacterium]
MQRILFVLFFLVFFINSLEAQNYNYLKAEVLKKWVDSGKKIHIIDVQKDEDFNKKHLKGSIATGAYPVKSDQDKAKLDRIVEKVKSDNLEIVIVCPRGGGAAKNTYEYMRSRGIEEKRLYILEGGIQEFPYKEMCL